MSSPESERSFQDKLREEFKHLKPYDMQGLPEDVITRGNFPHEVIAQHNVKGCGKYFDFIFNEKVIKDTMKEHVESCPYTKKNDI